ncbi:MAG: hypothetical protein ACP5GZ_01115 [Vulcanisaeta sp.]|uniref:hypothetical protein n=1 Tax=Vulcanisaeta sp. TaxID=2020871 RepID=UPI003D0EEA4C
MNCILMSLKPQFADEVLTGQKKCEVRTFMGTISKGSIVLVYYSSPVRLVRGYFIAGDSIIVRPSELMSILSDRCRDMPRNNMIYVITKYLRSKKRILILDITNPTILPKAITIAQLK